MPDDEPPPHPQSDLPCPKTCRAPESASDPWSVPAFWPATWIALPAATAAARGRLVGLLRRRRGVAGRGRRADGVRLRDVAAVTGARDANRRGGVRRADLLGGRTGERALRRLRLLAGDLDRRGLDVEDGVSTSLRIGSAATARAALRLGRRLGRRRRVAGRRGRADGVRLRHGTVVTGAEHPDRAGRVRRIDLLRARQRDRGLIRAGGLIAGLDPRPRGVLRGVLVGRAEVAGVRRRTCGVRLVRARRCRGGVLPAGVRCSLRRWLHRSGAAAAAAAVPACVCVAFWVVDAELPDVAVEPTVLACDTEPSSPGLSTRIETFVFDG